MKVKEKKCKHCNTKFTPVSSLQTTCSIKCAKALEKAKKVAKIAKEKEKKLKAKKKKQASTSFLSKKLDIVFGQYIRKRDAIMYGVCVTCEDKHTYETLQCGHFITRASKSTRWNEMNSSGQCYICNVCNHGRQFEHGI